MMKHTCAASVPYAGAVGPADKNAFGKTRLASRGFAAQPLTTPAQRAWPGRNDARVWVSR